MQILRPEADVEKPIRNRGHREVTGCGSPAWTSGSVTMTSLRQSPTWLWTH